MGQSMCEPVYREDCLNIYYTIVKKRKTYKLVHCYNGRPKWSLRAVQVCYSQRQSVGFSEPEYSPFSWHVRSGDPTSTDPSPHSIITVVPTKLFMSLDTTSPFSICEYVLLPLRGVLKKGHEVTAMNRKCDIVQSITKQERVEHRVLEPSSPQILPMALSLEEW